MKTTRRHIDFNCTASGIYALAMEQALSENRRYPQPVKPEKIKRIKLDGGCLLYRMPKVCGLT